MWYHTLDEQHEEKMKLLKEQQKTLSEIADALRILILIAQQTKDNTKSDSNPSKKDEDRCGVTQDNTNLLNNLPADHIFL